ncbi:MAG: hypothetical protein JWP57_51 [Spirosoma sp.]|nr:hypothetical protein [Spirosoma sp.]
MRASGGYPEEIKVGKVARMLSVVVKQAEAVPHEMQNGIRHFQQFTNGGPCIAI